MRGVQVLCGLARLVAGAGFVLQAATSTPCPRINDLKVLMWSVWFEIRCVELCAPRNTILIIQHDEFFLLFFLTSGMETTLFFSFHGLHPPSWNAFVPSLVYVALCVVLMSSHSNLLRVCLMSWQREIFLWTVFIFDCSLADADELFWEVKSESLSREVLTLSHGRRVWCRLAVCTCLSVKHKLKLSVVVI